MRAVSALLAVASLGCGRLEFAPGVVREDAAIADAPDVPPELPTFAQMRELSELNVMQTDDPTLTADELQIFFASARTGDEDIYTARRSTRDEAFTGVAELTAFSTSEAEGSPELTADGLTLYVSTNRGPDLGNPFVSVRPAINDEFTTLDQLTDPVNTSEEQFSTTPTADNLSLYFQHQDLDGVRRLYASHRASTSEPWPVGTRVFPDDPYDARNPFPTTDGRALYFASSAPTGIAAAGASQIFVALRARSTDPWGTPQVVPSLVDAYTHGDPWLSPAGDRIYLVRVSDTDPLDSKIFVATRVD